MISELFTAIVALQEQDSSDRNNVDNIDLHGEMCYTTASRFKLKL